MIYAWHIFSLRKYVRFHYCSVIDTISVAESEGGLLNGIF